MKRTSKILLALLLMALVLPGAAEAADYEPIPELLRVRQHTVTLTADNTRRTKRTRTYPDTGNNAVNTAVSRMVDALAAEAETHLPGTVLRSALADAGATVRVTGTKTVSFLVYAHTDVDHEQVFSAFRTVVYNLKNGKRLRMRDLFTEDADAVIRAAVTEQLNAYFPDEEAEAETVRQLCADITKTAFTLSPAYLILHYQASALYAGKTGMLHVKIPYRQLKAFMTDYARKELDNSRYLLVAMTFDDGPGRGVTGSMLTLLREWGAVGTFFNCGVPMRNGHDYVAWEHDAGHAVQSHTYSHTVSLKSEEKMKKERDRFAKEQTAIIGIPPAYMRAPGGNDRLYCKYDIGMPVIRWNVLTGDAAEDKPVTADSCVSKMVSTLKQTAIVLMHNIRYPSVDGAAACLDRLAKRGYLTVTVDELFEIRDIPLVNNVVYYGHEADQQE